MKRLLHFIAASLASLSLSATAADKPAPKATAEVSATKRFRNIDVAEWEKLRKDASVVVLDVRTAEEFADGHMPGAINLDIRGGKFAETLAGLDKSKTYLVHCAVGGRSAKACGQMDGMKFDKVLNLSGGITAWEAAGHKPVKGR
ncbi:MAG: rhodanese-like domain-containing protein [Verrucomicrobiota bacterium]|jgi:phage shock protein E|nr:rhodanese-like domain-containing protein [Verrucomicrobiota bacterium]